MSGDDHDPAQSGAAPWHREPWAWLVFSIPAVAVLMGAVLLFVAGRSYDGLVADDYYKRGLEINRSLERDRVAASHRLQGSLVVVVGELVTIDLSGEGGFVAPPALALSLHHATRDGLDRTVMLRLQGDRRYQGVWPALEPGAWNLWLGTANWRLAGRLQIPGPLRTTLRYPAG
jgi:hypothetical protein